MRTENLASTSVASSACKNRSLVVVVVVGATEDLADLRRTSKHDDNKKKERQSMLFICEKELSVVEVWVAQHVATCDDTRRADY